MDPRYLLIIPIIQIILGVVVLKRNPKNTRNWSFGFMMFFVAVWGIVCLTAPYIPLEFLTFTQRLSFASSALIASFLLVFSLSVGSQKESTILLCSPLIPGFIIAALSMTSFIAKSYTRSDLVLYPEYGIGLPIFTGYFITFMLLSLSVLLIRLNNAQGLEKYRIGYILFGTTISAIVGTFTNLIWPLMTESLRLEPVGPAASIFFTVFTAYAILKYRFLDVRVIIRKSFVYTLLIAIFFGFIVFFVAVLTRALENSLDISVWASAAILAVLLSAAYFPFHRTIQRVVTSLFTQSQPPFASPTLPPDVEEMKIKSGALIRKSIPVENAEMLFLAELPSRGWAKKEVTHLQTYFAHTTKALLLQEIPYVRTDGTIPPENLDQVERVLFSKDLAMIIPLYDREIKLFACMLVGPKAKGIFLADEISYLEAFARTLALRVDQILSETIVFENNRA